MSVIYCYNDPCESKATYFALVDGDPWPMCLTCYRAFLQGQSFDCALVYPIEDIEKLICPRCKERAEPDHIDDHGMCRDCLRAQQHGQMELQL